MSDRRWRRGESRQQLLDSALAAMAEVGPSGASGRRIAKAAGVHHAQIQQMFGSVDALLQASIMGERDRFIAEVFDTTTALPDPFAVARYPHFWRAVTQVVLDPGPIDLPLLAEDGPVQRVESHLTVAMVGPGDSAAIAGAWVAIPLGFMVFESSFRSDLGLSPEEMSAVINRAGERLSDLVARPVLPAEGRTYPPSTTPAPQPVDGAREQLVAAAQDLLATRLETSVRGRELADHARVNYGLINHHFGSKAAVFDQALVDLHARLVSDAVRRGGANPDLGGPDVFTRHRPFIRAWASRLIGGRPVPDFELAGMRALIDRTRASRGVGADDMHVVGDVLAAMALGLGWAVLAPLPTAGGRDADKATEQIYRVHHWLLDV